MRRDFLPAVGAGDVRRSLRINDRPRGCYLGTPSAPSPALNNSTWWLDFGGALQAHGGLREGRSAMTVRPTSRFSSPGLALLAPAAERRG
jgi:hypothetical protein